ncbi:MAG: carboxymuconolactone decarboxylase family protein [Paracoccaceae bacterium]|nr:carboxymuconolactone decarboxylase family protein [Paracoccaceae bacterium]
MSDFTKLFEQMMEQGQQMVRAFNPALEQFQAQGFEKMMPTLPKDMMEMFWGNAMNEGGLDAKTRLLAMIAGMTVQGVPVEPMFKLTLRHALEAGATEKEIGEVISQMSMLGGLPAMTKALNAAKAVFAENEEGDA